MIEYYVYDDLNRLDVLTHYASDATPDDLSDNDKLAEFDYEVRADGKRVSVAEKHWLDHDDDPQTPPTLHETDIIWSYDEVGRLVQETIDHFDDDLDRTDEFIYDLTGNRDSYTTDIDSDGTIDEAITYQYDVNDRLEFEWLDSENDGNTDQTTTYGYDHTQQKSKTVADSAGAVQVSTTYDYNL